MNKAYITHLEATGADNRPETSDLGEADLLSSWVYRPCICIKVSTRKVQRQAKRFVHDIRRCGKSLRQSSQRFDMVPVGHEKDRFQKGT